MVVGAELVSRNVDVLHWPGFADALDQLLEPLRQALTQFAGLGIITQRTEKCLLIRCLTVATQAQRAAHNGCSHTSGRCLLQCTLKNGRAFIGKHPAGQVMQQAFGNFLCGLDATSCSLVGNESQRAVADLWWHTIEDLVQAITLSQGCDTSTSNNGRILLCLCRIVLTGFIGHHVSALAKHKAGRCRATRGQCQHDLCAQLANGLDHISVKPLARLWCTQHLGKVFKLLAGTLEHLVWCEIPRHDRCAQKAHGTVGQHLIQRALQLPCGHAVQLTKARQATTDSLHTALEQAACVVAALCQHILNTRQRLDIVISHAGKVWIGQLAAKNR